MSVAVRRVREQRRRRARDMKAVITAILLDPEARGDVKTDPNYGHLREPFCLRRT